jgi:hypothetical protein
MRGGQSMETVAEIIREIPEYLRRQVCRLRGHKVVNGHGGVGYFHFRCGRCGGHISKYYPDEEDL